MLTVVSLKEIAFLWANSQSNGLGRHLCHCTGRTELQFIDGNLNAAGYKKIILQQVVPILQRHANTVFQHDNARPHITLMVSGD